MVVEKEVFLFLSGGEIDLGSGCSQHLLFHHK
jgi:hypothetical protein